MSQAGVKRNSHHPNHLRGPLTHALLGRRRETQVQLLTAGCLSEAHVYK